MRTALLQLGHTIMHVRRLDRTLALRDAALDLLLPGWDACDA